MDDTDDLTDKQRAYVQGLAGGMGSRQAALAAGYSDSYAKVAAHRLKKKPSVAAAIEAVRSEARREATYELIEAVKEIDRAVLFAYAQKNAMAIAKLLESKGKLFGLYVDRYQEVPVDLKGALAEARGRVLTMINPIHSSADGHGARPRCALSADGAKAWKPFSAD